MASSNEYCAGGIQPPTVQSLRESAARTGLTLSDQQLQQYTEVIAGFIPDYTLTANLPEPTLPVKYPRTPGYRPPPQENTHNAWYWKTDIVGASTGPLAGMKVAIKDNIAVAGVPFMSGSRIMEGYMPEFDATVVTRILDAGGRITGKTACEDLGFSGSSITSAKGTIKNPVDTSRVSGGSSAGSAVLLALGEVDLAMGGDQGGSVRTPASWCGVVGLKPTFGLVPYTGAITMEPTIDHLGPMANNVKDLAIFLEVIAGADGYDFRQPETLTTKKYSEKLEKSVEGLKVAFLEEGFDKCEKNVSDEVKKMIGVFESIGVTVDWIALPEHNQAMSVFFPINFDGWWNNGIMGEGCGMGYKGFYPSSMSEYARRGFKMAANDAAVLVKMTILLGDYIKTNYGNQFYNKAQNLRPLFQKAYDDVLEKYDVIFMPTLPYVAPKIPSKDISIKDLSAHLAGMLSNTAQFDLTGHPALSLNVGYIEGLPVGGMIVGKMFDEETVLRLAYALEQALKGSK